MMNTHGAGPFRKASSGPLVALFLLLAGCELLQPQKTAVPAPDSKPQAITPAPQAPAPAPPVAAVVPPPPPQPIVAAPFDDALLKAANDLFSKAQLPQPDAAGSLPVVIDPLIDGMTGFQSLATRSMEARIRELVKGSYPKFDIQPFTASTVTLSPIVLIGTFTGVNTLGQTVGGREAFRICLALADLKTGKIISKARTFAKPEGVDITPSAYFRDSPTWTPDRVTEGYIKTCQATKPGDPIDTVYWDRIVTAALISEAVTAYDKAHYREALELYKSAQQTPAGDQLRVYNGIYLSSSKLGRRDDAAQAFGKIVDYGLANKRLAVKFLFRTGSTNFLPDPQLSSDYGLWIREIAQRTTQAPACLEIVGHTSRTGPEPLNERLSLLRAEYVRDRLEREAPPLKNRVITNGAGSRENMIGSGTDDARDALDRRVEFKIIGC
jgi:outer membrane protein OmpA-like peptidoglycan-associated protein